MHLSYLAVFLPAACALHKASIPAQKAVFHDVWCRMTAPLYLSGALSQHNILHMSET